MSVEDLILGAMAAVGQRAQADVALYVQEQMWYTAGDGVTRYLPVIAVAGGGYDPIPETLQERAAQHFGGLLAVAELRVARINTAHGLEPDDVAAIVEGSFAPAVSE
jgi:hypothetical protein